MSAKKSPRWSPVSSHDHNMNVFTTVTVFNITWFYITFDVKLATIILFLQKCHKTVGKVFGCMYRHHCYCLQSTNPQVSSANTPRWGWGGKGGAFWWIFCGCGEQRSFLGTTQLTIHSWRIAADDTKTGFRSLDEEFLVIGENTPTNILRHLNICWTQVKLLLVQSPIILEHLNIWCYKDETWVLSKYPEALEYLALSIVQKFWGTCSEGSFWILVGTCNLFTCIIVSYKCSLMVWQ